MAAESGEEEWTRLQALMRGSLLEDWATIWQSDLAATALDREVQEGWQALLAGWAANFSGNPAGEWGAGAAAAAGSATAAAASLAGGHARDAELARLAARVAELERRLSERE